MSLKNNVDAEAYLVPVNGEERLYIWPADRALPAGWRSAGMTGSRDACLAHVDAVWAGMRPLSLRKQMTSAGS